MKMMEQKDWKKCVELAEKTAGMVTKKGIPCICEVYTYTEEDRDEIALAVDAGWVQGLLEKAADKDKIYCLPITYFTGSQNTYQAFKTALEQKKNRLLKDWGWAVKSNR